MKNARYVNERTTMYFPDIVLRIDKRMKKEENRI